MKTKLLALTFLSLIAAVLLAGCNSSGGGGNPRVTKENFAKLTNGMSRADVVEILGEPSGTEAAGQLNQQQIQGHVWQGSNAKIVVAFNSEGKLISKRMD
jgi:SmpA/OmlA family protein